MLEQIEFVFTYGEQKKIKQKKKSSKPKVQILDDPNRQYMIKYKYDTITPEQLQIFHNQIEKLIYDTIRKNYVQLEIKDVYQEIWKKIAKAKHSWKQDMGTRVSTWIVLVCLSVINGLRAKAKKHQDRYVLYNDLNVNEEDNDKIDKGQTIAIKYGLTDDKNLRNMYFSEDFKYFLESLNEKEKKVVDLVLNVNPEQLNENGNVKYKKKRITKTFLRSKIDIKPKEFQVLMNGLKTKFRQMILHRDTQNASEDN